MGTGVHQPLVYNVVKTGVKTPLVYNTPLVNTVYKTAAVSTGVHQPIVYNSAVQTPLTYHTYGKREAEPEADPALVYTTNTLPLTTAVHQPLVYNSAVHPPLLKTVDNAVVPAVGGYIHSSH